MNKLAIRLIKYYQNNISSQTNPRCRHTPTCSNYGLVAYKRFNFFKATFLTTKRILTCNPFFKPKYDPVPEKVLNPKLDLIFACIKKDSCEDLIIAYSFQEFLAHTKEYDLSKDDLKILCINKNNNINYTLSNYGYIIKKEDAYNNLVDTLNYQTNELGIYTLNKAFYKIQKNQNK